MQNDAVGYITWAGGVSKHRQRDCLFNRWVEEFHHKRPVMQGASIWHDIVHEHDASNTVSDVGVQGTGIRNVSRAGSIFVLLLFCQIKYVTVGSRLTFLMDFTASLFWCLPNKLGICITNSIFSHTIRNVHYAWTRFAYHYCFVNHVNIHS